MNQIRIKIQGWKCFLYIMFFILTTQQLIAQDISVSPISLVFEGVPGQTITKTLTLTNSSKTKGYDFSSSLTDWNRDLSGNRIYFPSGSLDRSMSSWIELSENNFSMAPGERKTITVSCSVPQTIVGSSAYNSMFFLTQTNPSMVDSSGISGIGILIAYEFGIQVFYNPASASRGDMEINNMSYVSPTDEQSNENGSVDISFFNTGQINKTGVLRFEITNKSTGAELKSIPRAFAIMPQAEQNRRLPLPEKLGPGSYLLVAVLDAGGHSLKIAEKDLVVE